jgi:hypothetical protein
MPARPLRLGSERVDATVAAPTTPPIFELPPHHFTTHGVVLGMTGSGKTGLSIVLVEEALRSGVPVIAIDLKGDLPNLLLNFPSLEKEAYLPWVDTEAAARDGLAPEQVAQSLADKWRAGLEKSGLGSADLQALRDVVEPRIITPGARIAEPVDVLSSLSRRSPLWDEDEDAALEQLAAGVSLLLQLAGRDGDPRGRDHVVLSALAERRLRAGETAPLDQLLRDVLAPPVARIGAMDFAEFMPARDQQALAQDLNTLVASAKLKTWLSGAPLDVGAWLAKKNGKTPLVIFSVAHLDDAERALVLGLLLEEVLTWVRSLSGTSELRALLLFDEVFGFLPPHPANPPTKKPLLALLKQARAFGVGVVLATQNPMDLDYKALSNAGVWCVGRLQTDADRERVVEGLLGADGGLGGLDAPTLGTILRNLPPRTFFVRDVHRTPACALLETRFSMSWLRGPMTRKEIAKLAKELSPVAPATEPALAVADTVPDIKGPVPSGATPPIAPEGWATHFGPVGARPTSPLYRPYVAITVVLRATDAKLSLSIERRHTLIAAFDAAGRIDAAQVAEIDPRTLGDKAEAGIRFAPLPKTLDTKKGAQAVEKSLREHAAARIAITVDVHRELGLHRGDSETRELFAARCNAEAERRSLASNGGSTKENAAMAKLEQRVANANQELYEARQALSAAPSEIGTAFLRAALGRGAAAPLNKQRAKAEARLAKAEDAARRADQQWREAQAERAGSSGVAGRDRVGAGAIETVRLLPKRGGVEVASIGIAWSAIDDRPAAG